LPLALELLNDEEFQKSPGREQVKRLREIKRDLIAQVREIEKQRAEFRTRRDEENKQVKELFHKAREARENRDIVNEDVKLNKALRDLRQEDAEKVLAELEKLEEQMKDMGYKPKSRNRQSTLARQIKQLEMEIQTTPNLKPTEEKDLVDKIDKLYQEMDKMEVADEKREEMRSIQKRLRTLRSEALAHHKEVKKLAAQSQEFHDVMLDAIKDARKIRTQADENHKKVVELSEEIKVIRKDITKVTGETDKIRKQLGEETGTERRKRKQEEAKVKEQELDDQAESILERYQSGEKLGFEEFKLLISRGLLNE
jgi:uncharacterized coiled-coil DUF342 family protein